MKNLAFALSLAIALVNSAPAAFARELIPAESSLALFFRAIEGRWRGDGVELSEGASSPLRIELEVERGWERNWRMRTETETASGAVLHDTTEYSASGNLLYVGPSGRLQPVQVLESTPTSLVFHMRQADVRSGAVYDIRSRLRHFPFERLLEGQATVEAFGVVLRRQDFTLRR